MARRRRTSWWPLYLAAAAIVFALGPSPRTRRGPARKRRRDLGQWDIAPGETLLPDGHRDRVLEASMESFPNSDSPAWA